MHLLILLLTALHLCSHHTPATSAGSITEALFPGRSLAAGDKLVSGNGKFALGFFQLAGAGSNKSSPDTTESRWHVGIWFNKIPKFTPVWVANRDNPLADPSSPELTFSKDGNLVLLDRATNSTVWSTQANVTATTSGATVLVLLETGNLVLRRRSAANASDSDALWQSFDHPTDTLLPDATIGLDKLTGRTRRLVSRKNLFDQSPGAYSMELGLDGVVRLLWSASVLYWSSGDWDVQYGYFSSVPGMALRHVFDFTFVDDGREVSSAYHLRGEAAAAYSFLDVSGQRKVLLWRESSREWLTIYTHPELRCDAHAACGPFVVCDDGAAASPCGCMRGFSVAAPGDWELGDRTAGMAKLVARDLSRVLTTARGTVGYLAPEWVAGTPVTPKVDVYAFGMVLLEIVSGRMNSQEDCSGGGEEDDYDDVAYFPVLVARKLLEGDKAMSLVDRRLGGDAAVEEVQRACKVACWCIQDSEVDRPTMGKVVQILEGLIEVEMPPVPRLLTAIAGRSHSACT